MLGIDLVLGNVMNSAKYGLFASFWETNTKQFQDHPNYQKSAKLAVQVKKNKNEIVLFLAVKQKLLNIIV